MNENALLQEFTKSMNKHREEVSELLKAYDLAKLGVDMLRQQEKEIYEEVLNDYEFYASEEKCANTRAKDMCGQRITEEKWDFLLSDEDFDRLTELARPIFVARNITDDNGYYIVNWIKIECDARNELVSFIIDNLLPESMREGFARARYNVVYQDKLIDVIRGCFA